MGRREYRNTGAPFETEDGRTVERGEVAELSESDARRRAHKLEPAWASDPLGGIEFASDPARELAAEKRLTADDFDGIDPSGQTGYTKADVGSL